MNTDSPITRIYLDACCINRPFDDQSQARIRLESEAIEHVLRAVEEGVVAWVSSEAVLFEVSKCPDASRREALLAICGKAGSVVRVDETLVHRAKEIQAKGFQALDSLHLACAEAAADVFLTTDDRIVSAARRLGIPAGIRVQNPVQFIEEVLI
ncbi:MAG: PIN domain-containing protein [Deltaproteobacteria bacterium]|nr:PIN domain-containing protein [Deltaproteobacteria bacterium]